jgi:hypothetical protein
MSNLIITVIAIGLVAALALSGIYYGGSYFSSMSANAEASAFLNVGSQVAHAWQAYTYDHNGQVPTSWQQMIDGGYLLSRPVVPAQVGGGAQIPVFIYAQGDANKTNYWLWYLLGRPGAPATASDPIATACLRVIKLVTHNTVTVPQSFAFVDTNFASPASGNGTSGCAQWDATQQPETNLYGAQLTDETGNYAAGYDYIGFYKLN